MTVSIDKTENDRPLDTGVESRERSFFKQAQQLVLDKQFMDAKKQLLEVLRLSPDYSLEAQIFLQKRLVIDHDCIATRVLLAEVLCFVNNYKEAVQELEDAFEINPMDTSIYGLLSKIYTKTGQKIKILYIFETAIEKGVFLTETIDSLTSIYLKEHNLEKAITLYKKLIKLFPDQVTYYKVLMELYIRNRQYDFVADVAKALLESEPSSVADIADLVRDLIKKAPRNVKLRKVLVMICFKLLKPMEAITHIKEWIRFHPNQLEEAIFVLKQSQDQFPDMPETLLLLSEYLIQTHAYSEGVRYLQTLFEKSPSYSETILKLLDGIIAHFPDQYLAMSLMATIFMSTHNYEKSLGIFKRLIEINKTDFVFVIESLEKIVQIDDKNKPYALLLLATVRFHQSRYEEAFSLTESLMKTSEALSAKLLQSKILIARKQYHKNWAVLDDALQSSPYFWDVHEGLLSANDEICDSMVQRQLQKVSTQEVSSQEWIELGVLFLLKGFPLKAIESFQKIHSSDSQYGKVLRLIARGFMDMGRFDMAINQFQKLSTGASSVDAKLTLDDHYFLGICSMNLGYYPQAIHHLERIIEVDLSYLNAKCLLDSLKSHSFLDLRGKAISLSFSLFSSQHLYVPFQLYNPENQLFFDLYL